MKKCKVCLIFGGKSNEYEVSLRSAYFILKSIDNSLFDVRMIGITRDGKWYFYSGDYEKILDNSWHKDECEGVIFDLSKGCFLCNGMEYRPDVAFPVMHGDFCEDGRLQGLFDIFGISYTGCGFFSSILSYNKHFTKQIARELKIPVARDILVTRDDLESFFDIVCRVYYDLSLPVAVKPCGSGSSVGVSIVNKIGDLYIAVKKALEYSPYALIEEFIVGDECEIGVLVKNGKAILSPVGKIVHGGCFYDYDTKYHSVKVKYEIPAKISPEASNKIRVYSRELFDRLGCKCLSRFDFFVRGNEVIFNEVNTMPGFTNGSMYPMLFESEGILASELIAIILKNNY